VLVSRERINVDGSALRRRYIATLDAAGLRRLRFHDLTHTFGWLAINVASIVQVQAWMGHTDIKTKMRYLHHKSRADDARLLSAALELQRPEGVEATFKTRWGPFEGARSSRRWRLRFRRGARPVHAGWTTKGIVHARTQRLVMSASVGSAG